MNVYKAVNIVCLILGIAVVIFGILIVAGVFSQIPTSKAPVPLLLGIVIVIWSLISSYRHR